MFNILTVFGLLSVLCSLPTAAFAAPVQADCFFVGPYKLTKNEISWGSAPDKAFREKNGVVQMKPIDRGALQAIEKLELGNNYYLTLQLDYFRKQDFGTKEFPYPLFVVSALLKYNDQVISAGSMQTDRITTQYMNGTGSKDLVVAFSLDNTLLRQRLGAADRPGLDLLDLLRASPEKEQIFSSLGDGDGVVLRADIHCKVRVSK